MHAFNLFAFLSRSQVTWNPSFTCVVKYSFMCPTTEEHILPIIHGNDRVEWFFQMSDEIHWDCADKTTGKPLARVIMKAGDMAAMPAYCRHQGYSPKRSMLLVWENGSPEPGLRDPEGRGARSAGQVLRRRSHPMNLADIQAAAGLRTPIRHQLFIDGQFVPAQSGETLATLNPHDNSPIADVAMAGRADVDLAVAAAQRAFPAWSRLAAADRGRILLKLADLIEANAEELARLESAGHRPPDRDSRALDVPRTAACFRYFGGMADKFQGETIPVEAGFLNYMLREPVGVVGQIVPWNFPLMFTSWKMAPALAAGNTIVMKPAELTPLSSAEDRRADGRGRHARRRRQHRAGARQRRRPVHRRAPGHRQDRLHRQHRHRPTHRAGVARAT